MSIGEEKGGIFMKKLYFFSLIVFVIFFLSGCVSTLKNYNPKNPDEAQIKDLLIQWEHTWNSGDVPGHLALWNDNAKIMYGKDRKIATKKEYVTILPERMRAIPSISLGSPTIKRTGNNADVDVNMSIGSYQSSTTYHLIKEHDSWSIVSWNY
jgi:cbb3-type cytochrome oxidase subunit 3